MPDTLARPVPPTSTWIWYPWISQSLGRVLVSFRSQVVDSMDLGEFGTTALQRTTREFIGFQDPREFSLLHAPIQDVRQQASEDDQAEPPALKLREHIGSDDPDFLNLFSGSKGVVEIRRETDVRRSA